MMNASIRTRTSRSDCKTNTWMKKRVCITTCYVITILRPVGLWFRIRLGWWVGRIFISLHLMFKDGNPIFSARAPNKKKIIKIIVDDNYDTIYDFNSSFDENLLYTVIVPIKLIDNIDVLITSFLLSE